MRQLHQVLHGLLPGQTGWCGGSCRGCARCARQAVCDAALAWPQRPVVWSFSADEIGAGVAEVARICDEVVASMWVIGYV